MSNSDMGKILNSHTVQFERVFPGPIDLVFDYLSKPELLEKWLMKAMVEPQVGGRIQYKSEKIPDSVELPQKGTSCCIKGIISAYDPPRLISYSWNEFDWDMTSEVRFELEERGNEVHLLLTHSRLPAFLMAGVGAGWHTHLDCVLALIKGETPAEFFSLFNPRVTQYKAALTAAGIVIASAAGSAAQASPLDPAYQSVKEARDNLMVKYDRLWKESDDLKYKMDHVDRNSGETGRVLVELDRELKQNNEEIHKIEFELRDLDKALR